MTEDEKRQIIDLVCGRSVMDEHGLTHQSYLRDGSAEELAAAERWRECSEPRCHLTSACGLFSLI